MRMWCMQIIRRLSELERKVVCLHFKQISSSKAGERESLKSNRRRRKNLSMIHMWLRMYVYTYICMCVCLYICMHIHVFLFVYVCLLQITGNSLFNQNEIIHIFNYIYHFLVFFNIIASVPFQGGGVLFLFFLSENQDN